MQRGQRFRQPSVSSGLISTLRICFLNVWIDGVFLSSSGNNFQRPKSSQVSCFNIIQIVNLLWKKPGKCSNIAADSIALSESAKWFNQSWETCSLMQDNIGQVTLFTFSSSHWNASLLCHCVLPQRKHLSSIQQKDNNTWDKKDTTSSVYWGREKKRLTYKR